MWLQPLRRLINYVLAGDFIGASGEQNSEMFAFEMQQPSERYEL